MQLEVCSVGRATMMKILSSIPATLTPSSHRIQFAFRSGIITLRCSNQRDYSSHFPLRYVPKKARHPGADTEFVSVQDLGKNDAVGCYTLSTSGQEKAHKLKVSPVTTGYEKAKMGFLFSGDDTDHEDPDHDLRTESDETVGHFKNLENKAVELNVQQGSSGSKEDAEKMAIKLLAARAYTALELKKKLIGKRFTVPIIDAVLSDFRSRGLINDSLYAEAYSRSRWLSSTWGPRRIQQALFTKGINASDTEKAVNLIFQECCCSDEEDSKHGLSQASMDHLYAQASKQWLRGQSANIEVRKARIIRWLQYRGFKWSVISYILKKCESL